MSIKALPETTPLTYISGLHSLNLDLRDGTGYDWRFSNIWLEDTVKLYGKDTACDTTDFFGYMGIADRSNIIKDKWMNNRNVYIANHTRAFIDYIYECLINDGNLGDQAKRVDFYFLEANQKMEVYKGLCVLLECIEDSHKEKLDSYLSWDFRMFHRSNRIETKIKAFIG